MLLTPGSIHGGTDDADTDRRFAIYNANQVPIARPRPPPSLQGPVKLRLQRR